MAAIKMSTKNITTRLHVAGLTPNITTEHIRDRFSLFGKVQDVEQPQPDALGKLSSKSYFTSSLKDNIGQARSFTFFTLETSPSQLKRCEPSRTCMCNLLNV